MSISISPDLEARIRDEVKAGAGSSVEDFVDRVLRQALDLFPERAAGEEKTSDQLEREVDDFFASIESNLPPDTPILPDKAFTRDAIYEDHN